MRFVAVLVVLISCGEANAQVDSFDLVSTDGGKLSIKTAQQPELTVLYFTGIQCPLAKLYTPRVNALAKEYSQTVRFFGINSNQQDSAEEFKEFITSHEIIFPCGKDFNNVVADRLDVKRTPEVIVLDKEFKVRYRGRIDDQYSPGIARNSFKRRDLKIAIDERLLTSRPLPMLRRSRGSFKRTASSATAVARLPPLCWTTLKKPLAGAI